MPRKDKSLQLRVVDDSNPEPVPAIRLENPETLKQAHDPEETRADSAKDLSGISRRLDVPDRDEVVSRTHQPGIEALIDAEMVVRDHIEEDWAEASVRRYPIPWGWFVLIGLVISGAMIWSLTRVKEAEKQIVQIRADAESVLVEQAREEQEAKELIERIETTIRNFIGASSVEALEPLVRQPERVVPLIRQCYAGKPVSLGRLDHIKMLRAVTLDNRADFWMASVAMGDGGKRSMVLEIGPDRKPRVDWETFVCYQPMPWDDYAQQKPEGSLLDFRVYVEKDNFYSHEFVDEKQWTCFRLTALKSTSTLFGYVPAESELARELQHEIEEGGGKVSVILRLSVPQGIQSRNGVVIEKMLSSRWIYIHPPDSGS